MILQWTLRRWYGYEAARQAVVPTRLQLGTAPPAFAVSHTEQRQLSLPCPSLPLVYFFLCLLPVGSRIARSNNSDSPIGAASGRSAASWFHTRNGCMAECAACPVPKQGCADVPLQTWRLAWAERHACHLRFLTCASCPLTYAPDVDDDDRAPLSVAVLCDACAYCRSNLGHVLALHYEIDCVISWSEPALFARTSFSLLPWLLPLLCRFSPETLTSLLCSQQLEKKAKFCFALLRRAACVRLRQEQISTEWNVIQQQVHHNKSQLNRKILLYQWYQYVFRIR